MRKLLFLLIIIMLLGISRLAQAQSGEVLVLEISGPVTPTMASYFERGIREAEAQDMNAILIQLSTPGGQIDIMMDIVQIISKADVPVIVYVAPEGEMAASAGSVITLAAHAAGMAPGTIIGAASPINSDGSDLSETAFRKETEALGATMRGLVERRGEAASNLAVRMITEAVAVNEREALAAGLIDAIATDTTDLLNQLDGLTVVINDQETILQTTNIAQRTFDMNLLEAFLHALANPIIIGILMAIGVQAVIAEVSNPGGWVAGLIGVLLIGMALYGLGQLPVNWLGFGLIMIAFVLFIAELFTPSHGNLSVAGTLCLFGGLLVLFNSPSSPEFVRISIPAAVAITGGTAAVFIFVITQGLRAQQLQPATGMESMVGKTGPVRQSLATSGNDAVFKGRVLINGELWQAQATEAIPFDERVIVERVDGFTLYVKKAADPPTN